MSQKKKTSAVLMLCSQTFSSPHDGEGGDGREMYGGGMQRLGIQRGELAIRSDRSVCRRVCRTLRVSDGGSWRSKGHVQTELFGDRLVIEFCAISSITQVLV